MRGEQQQQQHLLASPQVEYDRSNLDTSCADFDAARLASKLENFSHTLEFESCVTVVLHRFLSGHGLGTIYEYRPVNACQFPPLKAIFISGYKLSMGRSFFRKDNQDTLARIVLGPVFFSSGKAGHSWQPYDHMTDPYHILSQSKIFGRGYHRIQDTPT